MKERKGPKIVSSATACSTLLPPMTLLRLADQVARMTPTRTKGLQNVNLTMYIQSLSRRAGSQVRLVRRARMMKVVKVVRQADRVPLGILLAGSFRSPDRFAPAMMPVTPEKRT